MADDRQIIRFTLSGRRFDFDFGPELLTGDQTEIIRARTGMTALAFLRAGLNLTLDNFDERMLLVLAYLAEYRSNELLEWESFIRTVAPFDVAFLEEPADADGEAEEQAPAKGAARPSRAKSAPKAPAAKPDAT